MLILWLAARTSRTRLFGTSGSSVSFKKSVGAMLILLLDLFYWIVCF